MNIIFITVSDRNNVSDRHIYSDLMRKFRNEGQKTFLSPTPGEQLDWILVIDDASKGYPKPGSKEYKN